eukprot:103502_1
MAQAISVFMAIAVFLWLIAIVFMVSLLRRFYLKKQNSAKGSNISSKRTLYLSIAMFTFELINAISFMTARLSITLRDFKLINTNVDGLISLTLMIGTACIIIIYTLILYIFIARLYAGNSVFSYPKYFYIIIFSEITVVIMLTFVFGLLLEDENSIKMIQGISVIIGMLNGFILTYVFVHSVNKIVKDMGDHDNSDMIDLMCKFTVLLIVLIGTSTLFSLMLILYAMSGSMVVHGMEKCIQPFDGAINFLGIYLQFSFTKDDYMKWFGRLHEMARKVFTKETKTETAIKTQITLDTMSPTSADSSELPIVV